MKLGLGVWLRPATRLGQRIELRWFVYYYKGGQVDEHPYPIVMNLRKRADGSHSRHYRHPEQNQTLCGLSLKTAHAWAPSKAQFVNCQQCIKIAFWGSRRRKRR
jgi:hypothetical protein